MDSINTQSRKLDRVVIRSGGRIVFLKTTEIDWIEAAGNYLRIHCGEEVYLVRETMQGIEARLDARFLRIHRSTIVNVESIRLLEPCGNGEFIVQLYKGKGLSLSRTFRGRLDQFLRSQKGDCQLPPEANEEPELPGFHERDRWISNAKAATPRYSKNAEDSRRTQSCTSGVSSCD